MSAENLDNSLFQNGITGSLIWQNLLQVKRHQHMCQAPPLKFPLGRCVHRDDTIKIMQNLEDTDICIYIIPFCRF